MKKLTTDEFIERAIKVHGNKYDYSEVEYINTDTKVKIFCNTCKKYFWQRPYSHLNGYGCPCCKIEKIRNKCSSNTKDFIIKSQKIHGKTRYNYSKVNYINNNIKVKIFCNKCRNYFEQTPHIHLSGSGCPKCAQKIKNLKKVYSLNDILLRFKKVHKNKYDYSKVQYNNIKTKVEIICNKCNKSFFQTPGSHLSGRGCPYCCGFYKTTQDFIKKSQKIHGENYDYSLVEYKNVFTKVKIYCKKCKRYFYQTPQHHLRGQGCPYCYHSKGEEKIKRFLEENNISFEQQKRFNDCKDKHTLPFDFYLPHYNICIEFQGQQHYESGKKFFKLKTIDNNKVELLFNIMKYHDQIKRDYCKKNNIRLIEIKYNENIEEKLKLLLLKN